MDDTTSIDLTGPADFASLVTEAEAADRALTGARFHLGKPKKAEATAKAQLDEAHHALAQVDAMREQALSRVAKADVEFARRKRKREEAEENFEAKRKRLDVA